MTPRSAPSDVATMAQLACLLEVAAPKPGNVSPRRAFRDVRYEDFLASAAAIGPALGAAGANRLGVTIRSAVDATARWAPSNTNLGIILLLAPLARAALDPRAGGLRERLRHVLAETTVEDAADVYAAIRRVAPGGLGRADAQDVKDAPTVTLEEAMRLAADRDGVAREWSTGFQRTFEVGAPALVRGRAEGLSWSEVVVECFLTLLASAPDTHIARKRGAEDAARVSARARDVLAAGGVRSESGRAALAAFDAELGDARNTRNPGTTADLTAAALFVVLHDGEWR